MRLTRQYRAIIGGLIWIGLIAGVVLSLRYATSNSPDAVQQLVTYTTRQRREIQLELPHGVQLQTGDPIFIADSTHARPIGIVSRVAPDDNGVAKAWVSLFGNCPPVGSSDHFEFHWAPDSVDWMLRTMFHDQKKEELKQLIQNAVQANQEDLMSAFRPMIVGSLSEAGRLVKHDLQQAIANRQPQLQQLGDRYQNEILRERLLPVFQEEVWPIMQAEGEPLVTEVSREIWDEVSVFGFGWRYLYDRSPLPQRNLTERKFKEFVDQKAKPIIASHLDEFIALQKSISTKVVSNEKVKQAISDSVQSAAKDPEVQQLFSNLMNDVLLKNRQLHEAVRQQWNSPEARQAFSLANSRLDPTIREIGVSLFGTPGGGITPEFAKVLRRRILFKDSRWLTLHINPDLNSSPRNRDQPFPKNLPLKFYGDDTSIPVYLKGAADE